MKILGYLKITLITIIIYLTKVQLFLDLIDQMYSIFYEKYINIEYDKSMSGKVWDSFSDEKIIFLINFLELSEIHFDCFSDEKVLKELF